MEGDPGTRRYKWFRPRQAARGGVPLTTATNYATTALYNNSTGSTVLVVRDWQCSQGGDGNYTAQFGYYQGRLTGTNYPATPLFPGDAVPNGLVDYSDQPHILPAEYANCGWITLSAYWPHDFPFAILPPGWSLFLQAPAKTTILSFGIVWECVSIDELDYFY